ITALATSSVASPVGLNIPGIISLDVGGGNGLSLNVLGGLVHASVGGRGTKTPRAAPPAAVVPAVPAVPAVPFFPAFHPF
ncbi:hypothetical protein GGI03_007458, partial [Coemansia sp. RSA 2337]